MQVHERGPLPRSPCAPALSLPGIFPPAVINGQLAIDGGILDNLPVDLMRRRPVGRVIAVDLTSRNNYAVDYDAVPSPWAVLAGRYAALSHGATACRAHVADAQGHGDRHDGGRAAAGSAPTC